MWWHTLHDKINLGAHGDLRSLRKAVPRAEAKRDPLVDDQRLRHNHISQLRRGHDQKEILGVVLMN
jgi:hypothetical protein